MGKYLNNVPRFLTQPVKVRSRPQNADRLSAGSDSPIDFVYQRDPATKHEFEDNIIDDTTNNTATLARYTPY
jgi:hypothetical protein